MTSSHHNLGVWRQIERRRGAAMLLAATLMVFILGLAALAVDAGFIYMNYAQLQTCADSGSLAGAGSLVSDALVKAAPDYTVGVTNARSKAVQFASANQVGASLPTVDPNTSNSSTGDVYIGYLADPTDPDCPIDTTNPALYNAVQVRVRKNSTLNGPVTAFFSRVLGNQGKSVAARATAVITSSVVGFRVTEESGNADLLPFAVDIDDWRALLAGAGGDSFTLGSDGTVSSGGDGILEMSMYPQTNLTPGNFGTVDIGPTNNSTATLSRQIREGVNADDLSYHGGALQLGEDGTLVLSGDTGISAGIKDDLITIKGKRRSIMLYTTVVGNGENALYTIVGFAGIRIMDVKLSGNPKYVIIQPSAVVDHAAISGDAGTESSYVYSNPRIAR